jgi:hypothetical protein
VKQIFERACSERWDAGLKLVEEIVLTREPEVASSRRHFA